MDNAVFCFLYLIAPRRMEFGIHVIQSNIDKVAYVVCDIMFPLCTKSNASINKINANYKTKLHFCSSSENHFSQKA